MSLHETCSHAKKMTLLEAIEHCEEKSCGNTACAQEHKQLAEWLNELKELMKIEENLLGVKRKKLLIESTTLFGKIEKVIHLKFINKRRMLTGLNPSKKEYNPS